MDNKVFQKVSKLLKKQGYSEEKINELINELDVEDEPNTPDEKEPTKQPLVDDEETNDEGEKSTPEDKEPDKQVVEPAKQVEPEPEITSNTQSFDVEKAFKDFRDQIISEMKGFREDLDGVKAKNDKSYEMLSAMGSPTKPEEPEDKYAKMFGGEGTVSESLDNFEQNSIESSFEQKIRR